MIASDSDAACIDVRPPISGSRAEIGVTRASVRHVMRTSAAAGHIRSHKNEIAETWERTVLGDDLPALRHLNHGALVDHLPDVLDALAAWLDGDTPTAERGFAAFAEQHALARLALGIEIDVLHIEYARLRRAILHELLALGWSDELRDDLIPLNDAIDRAIYVAVRRYSEHREYMRERFIGILAHDLRNPLNATSMAVDALLESASLGSADRARVLMISRAAQRMERMIDDVLDFARGHLGGGIPVQRTADNLADIAHTAVEEATNAHPDRAIHVSTIGDLRGRFDRDRVLQALGNLITNAVRYGMDPIRVDAWESDQRDAVFTRVTNAARERIPDAMLATLFEPFRQADDQRQGSLGLGLYIVAEIARAHGGTCEVSSSESETSFTIRWPRTPMAKAPA